MELTKINVQTKKEEKKLPVEVNVRFNIRMISNVDSVKQTFEAIFFMELCWLNPAIEDLEFLKQWRKENPEASSPKLMDYINQQVKDGIVPTANSLKSVRICSITTNSRSRDV
jgi:hypothetical protein